MNHEPERHPERWTAMATGALAGAMLGYALRTPRGRRLFDSVILILDDFSLECARFCQSAARARLAAEDSWEAVRGSKSTQIH